MRSADVWFFDEHGPEDRLAAATKTSPTPPDMLADLDAVLKHLAARTPVDPDLGRRVRERSQTMTQELCRQYGEMNVAVDLFREIRDEA